MNKKHIVIAGTGRCGTTFLVQLLTQLGLDTGFDARSSEALPHAAAARLGSASFFPAARAGMEMDIRSPAAPYIVKTPFFCDIAEEFLASSPSSVEHVIVPVRRIEAAAMSRAYVQRSTTGSADGEEAVPGGLWETDKAELQAEVLRRKFVRLIEALVYFDVPMTFLMYPRLASDKNYLFAKLAFLLADIGRADFDAAFDKVVRPDWVHQFSPADQ
ncbi:hypothetical protein ACNHKD_03090 [Methylocystis sp. JAN1]|uniref:hypothetical protein n=1 Tax=Methylocystis sp. JAN1 TaxID=3397211 RepID=UPI003FA25335